MAALERDVSGTVFCPTSFPNSVNFGATFNDSLAREMGAIIGVEARALWLAGATEESVWSGRKVIGLTVWSPNINIARDPRWGRLQEVRRENTFINTSRAGHTPSARRRLSPPARCQARSLW